MTLKDVATNKLDADKANAAVDTAAKSTRLRKWYHLNCGRRSKAKATTEKLVAEKQADAEKAKIDAEKLILMQRNSTLIMS